MRGVRRHDARNLPGVMAATDPGKNAGSATRPGPVVAPSSVQRSNRDDQAAAPPQCITPLGRPQPAPVCLMHLPSGRLPAAAGVGFAQGPLPPARPRRPDRRACCPLGWISSRDVWEQSLMSNLIVVGFPFG